MTKKNPALVLAGAALVGGLALSSSAFAMTDLASGYMLAASDTKAAEGKCGEGNCGVAKMDTDKDGKVSQTEFGTAHQGDTTKFAALDTNKDGFVDGTEFKSHSEGKCGEGKCGGEMDKKN